MEKNYSNETMRLLFERASCRTFEDKPIEAELLNEVIDAGLHGATGGNLQPFSIIKITDKHSKKRLVNECHMQNIVENAPVNLLFCIDFRRIKRWCEVSNAPFVANKSASHFWIAFQDTIICAQNICTAADSVGLGSVYIGTVESCFLELKPMFDIPEGVFPVVLLSLGYPKKYPKPANKLGIEALVHDEKYQDLSEDLLRSVHDEKYEHRTYPLSESNVKQIYEVAEDIGGKEYADHMIEKMNEVGHVNMAQRYFGLHYKANLTCTNNSNFIKALKTYDFPWINGINFPE